MKSIKLIKLLILFCCVFFSTNIFVVKNTFCAEAPSFGIDIKKQQKFPKNYFFGTCTHWGRKNWDLKKRMLLLEQSGFGWIRDDIGWQRVETKKGEYVIPQSKMDWIREVHDHGFKILLVINGSNNLYANPYDPDAYAKYAADVAEQLKGMVDAYEILNEPHNFGFVKYYGGEWNGLEKDGSISGWLEKYVILLNKSAKAIKKVDPNVKVVGLGSVPSANFRQLEMGISSDVDGIVDHPYSYCLVPEIVPFSDRGGVLKRDGIATADSLGTFESMIRMYRQQSAIYNGPKEIWLTEFGYSTYLATKKKDLSSGFTPKTQAKYLQRRFMECLGLGIDVSFQYDFLEDGEDPCHPEHHYGIIDTDGKPKPAYYALQRLMKATIDFSPEKSVSINVYPLTDRVDRFPVVWEDGENKFSAPGTIKTYAFEDTAGKTIIAFWSAERANEELTPRLANMEIILSKDFNRILIQDLLTGEETIFPFEKHGDKILIEKIKVPDYPSLLIFEE